jgi:hypothetical protein
LKLIGFLRYDFELDSIFKFVLVFEVRFSMQYESMMPCNISVLYVPHQKKSSLNIYGVHIVGGKGTLIPIVSFNEMTYRNVVSVPAEEHNRYIQHTSTLIPQVALCV